MLKMFMKILLILIFSNYVFSSEVSNTALHKACDDGDIYAVSLLIDMGYEVNEKEKNSDFTPIYYAIIKQDKEIIDLLIKNRADVNVKTNKYFETPLHLAYYSNVDEKLIELLISEGANPEAKNLYGKKPGEK